MLLRFCHFIYSAMIVCFWCLQTAAYEAKDEAFAGVRAARALEVMFPASPHPDFVTVLPVDMQCRDCLLFDACR